MDRRDQGADSVPEEYPPINPDFASAIRAGFAGFTPPVREAKQPEPPKAAKRVRVAPVPATQWPTLQEAAEIFGVSTRTMRRRIADGTVRATRFGPRLIRIDPSSIQGLSIMPTDDTA
jgi:excisionase family DNA binding protein